MQTAPLVVIEDSNEEWCAGAPFPHPAGVRAGGEGGEGEGEGQREEEGLSQFTT